VELGLDAYAAELPRDGLAYLRPLGDALEGRGEGELHVESVGVARLGEHLLGAIGIVGIRGDLLVEARGDWEERAVQAHRVAQDKVLSRRAGFHRVVERLPYLALLERLEAQRIEADVDLLTLALADARGGTALELLDPVVGHGIDDVHLAPLERG